jgi:hypothetical protein
VALPGEDRGWESPARRRNFTRGGSDIPQSQNGRAIGDNRHQVGLGGVLADEIGIAMDFHAGRGHAR